MNFWKILYYISLMLFGYKGPQKPQLPDRVETNLNSQSTLRLKGKIYLACVEDWGYESPLIRSRMIIYRYEDSVTAVYQNMTTCEVKNFVGITTAGRTILRSENASITFDTIEDNNAILIKGHNRGKLRLIPISEGDFYEGCIEFPVLLPQSFYIVDSIFDTHLDRGLNVVHMVLPIVHSTKYDISNKINKTIRGLTFAILKNLSNINLDMENTTEWSCVLRVVSSLQSNDTVQFELDIDGWLTHPLAREIGLAINFKTSKVIRINGLYNFSNECLQFLSGYCRNRSETQNLDELEQTWLENETKPSASCFSNWELIHKKGIRFIFDPFRHNTNEPYRVIVPFDSLEKFKKNRR